MINFITAATTSDDDDKEEYALLQAEIRTEAKRIVNQRHCIYISALTETCLQIRIELIKLYQSRHITTAATKQQRREKRENRLQAKLRVCEDLIARETYNHLVS